MLFLPFERNGFECVGCAQDGGQFFDLALLSWVNTDQSEFRSQLLGDEDKPTAWSRQNERSFSHLPPGHYRLRVEGRDHAGNLSTPVELTIDFRDGRTWLGPFALAPAPKLF